MQKQKKTETDQKYFEPEMRDKHYVSYMIVIIFFLFKRRTCECGCFFFLLRLLRSDTHSAAPVESCVCTINP